MLRHTGFQAGHLRLHVQQVPEGLAHFGVQGPVTLGRHFLSEVSDVHLAGRFDPAAVGAHGAAEEIQEGAFAAAVGTHQANLAAGFNLPGNVSQNRYPPAKALKRLLARTRVMGCQSN